MRLEMMDVYRTAKLLIDQHGDDAPLRAAMRADECLEAGDTEGAAVWRSVIRAIEDLLSEDGTRH